MPSLRSTQRQERILRRLARYKRIRFTDLEKALDASPATLRRDLAALEAEGRLLRVHGGIVLPESILPETTHNDREQKAATEKEKIAARAAASLGKTRRIFIDAGTTCLAFARKLTARKELTLYTHSISILALAMQSRARIVGLGGECRSVSLAMVGTVTLDWIRRLRFDACYLGASGLDKEEGLFTTELTECAVKQAAISRSRLSILLADQSKLQAASTVRFATWNEVNAWISERGLKKFP